MCVPNVSVAPCIFSPPKKLDHKVVSPGTYFALTHEYYYYLYYNWQKADRPTVYAPAMPRESETP